MNTKEKQQSLRIGPYFLPILRTLKSFLLNVHEICVHTIWILYQSKKDFLNDGYDHCLGRMIYC